MPLFSKSEAIQDQSKNQVEAIFRGVLGRQPSELELVQLSSQLLIHGNLESIVRDLIRGEEFSIQVLPELIAKWTQNYNGKKIFFLHVPKTAGTSVRLAISKAIGVPSLHLYRAFLKPNQNSDFWPFWAGHEGIFAFPSTHEGFTIFRETRSRLLSLFRQKQEEAGDKRRIPLEVKPRAFESPQKPTVIWEHPRSWLESWFHLDSSGRVNDINQTLPSILAKLSAKEKREGFERGLSRIGHSSWVHEGDALLSAVGSLVGHEVKELPKENVFEHKQYNFEPIKLSSTDMDWLNKICKLDEPVIQIATSLGLIPRLEKSVADDLFVETAKRLKFEIP